MSVDKVIVSSLGRLRAKYGKAGAKKVESAVQKLIQADEKRGVHTTLVYLDDKVRNPSSRAQNKHAIDDVYAAWEQPDYLLILGAPDIIPHQSLRNPTGGPGGDGDPNVPSDLPYACDAPSGRDIEDFIGPTRVVGRLPNVMGDEDPGYLVSLLQKVSSWKRRSARSYGKGFVLSAAVWNGSTRKSAKKLFSSSTTVQLSPPKETPWTTSLLGRRVHFINCHGNTYDPTYYGEGPDEEYSDAHHSKKLRGIKEGTIAAVECCYGAELYDPEELAIDGSVCNAYLHRGTYGFLGSTNVAYGPVDSNGAADLICQYFIRAVLKGASIGRATLEARQEFVRQSEPLDPVDLKTLGQFYLLGDPSVHPVKPKAGAKQDARGQRRKRLAKSGEKLLRESSSVASVPDRVTPAIVQKSLGSECTKLALAPGSVRTFDLRKRLASKKRSKVEGRFHIAVEKARRGAPVHTKRILVSKELHGQIVETLEYHPR